MKKLKDAFSSLGLSLLTSGKNIVLQLIVKLLIDQFKDERYMWIKSSNRRRFFLMKI